MNAAGSRLSQDAAEAESPEAIRQTIELNLIAPMVLAQAVFPHMVETGRGSIVNVSSIGGRVGVPGIPQASYAASKMGLSGLTAELAVQWARHSIRVNTIAPGFFRSEITGELYDDERGKEWLRRNTPLPLDGTVDDFVGAVLWLASDAGRYVTGQTIVIDGGWTARERAAVCSRLCSTPLSHTIMSFSAGEGVLCTWRAHVDDLGGDRRPRGGVAGCRGPWSGCSRCCWR